MKGRGKVVNKLKSGGDLYKELGKIKPPKNIDKKINPALKKSQSNRSLLKSSKSSK